MKLIRTFSIAVMFLMLASLVMVPLSPAVTSSAQTSGSCPSTNVLRFTLNGGVPNSLTALTTSVFSGYTVGFMTWLGAYAGLSPTGALLWNYSIADSVVPNINYTQWSFHVRPGMKWSNGQPITAQDILATYGPNYAFNSSYDFVGESAKVVKEFAANSSTAVFDLNTPDAWFPFLISPTIFTSVVAASAVNQSGSAYTGFGNTVGDGPFVPVGYSSGASQMVMKANPYWSTIGLSNPKICEVDVNFVESDSAADQLLEQGGTDIAPVDPTAASAVLKTPNLGILDLNASEIMTMDYNITTYPFNMTQFRQAMVFAINQNQITQQAVSGYASTAYNAEGIVPSVVSTLYNPNQVQYSFNATQALKLLSQIGITRASSGQLQYSNGTAVSLTLQADTEESKDTLAAQVVTNDLKAIGMNINTQIVARKVISGAPSEVPLTMYLTTGEAPVFPSAYSDALPGWDVYTHPAIASKYWMYPPSANTQYFGNLSALSATADLTSVKQYLNNIQLLNAQYLPVIVLSYPNFLWGYSTKNWVNWGSYPNTWFEGWNNFDFNQLINLTPAGSATSTSSSSVATSASSSAASSASASSSVASSSSSAVHSTTSAASSSSSSSSAVALNPLAVVITVAVVAGALGGVLVVRRRRLSPMHS